MEEASSGSDFHPRPGNYVGGTYKVAGLDGDQGQHEAQAGDVASVAGSVLLDYLRATVPDTADNRAALQAMLGVWTPRDRGWRGWYDVSWEVLDGGLVAACMDPARAAVQGILVDLPGRACASLGNDLPAFFVWCCEVGHITRADYALDDRAGLLTRDRILDCEAAGGLVSRWQTPLTEVCQRKRGKLAGWTLYLGSREGEAMMRFYDKAAQQGLEGVHWVRCELETKGDLADSLARQYLADGAAAVVGQINRRVRFAEQPDDQADSNSRRWEACAWWTQFLGSIDQGPALCAGERVKATIERMREHVERQAGPALAAILEADGNRLWLSRMVQESRERWRSKHKAAIELAKGEGRYGYVGSGSVCAGAAGAAG